MRARAVRTTKTRAKRKMGIKQNHSAIKYSKVFHFKFRAFLLLLLFEAEKSARILVRSIIKYTNSFISSSGSHYRTATSTCAMHNVPF